MGSQRQDHFHDVEQIRDWEGSVYTTHIRSQSWGGSHVSYEENARNMQLKIDHLQRKLRHELRRKTPLRSVSSSSEEGDGSYRPKPRTPLN
nr:hypothetical protein CFP56_30530 [Quercus suber]